LTVPDFIRRMSDPSTLEPLLEGGSVLDIVMRPDPSLSVRVVRHTAVIDSENTGGPLLDKCGNVTGINSSAMRTSNGSYFSIHSAELIRFLQELNTEFSGAPTAC